MVANRRLGVLHVIAFVVGVIALIIVVERLGWLTIQHAIVGAGPWFVVLALIDLASVMCDAGGLTTIARSMAPIRYRRVLFAQASGLAINRLTPGNSLGEPLKATLLMEHMPRDAAIATIVMFNLVMYIVAMSVMVIGIPLTFVLLDLPSSLRAAVVIAAVVLIGAIAGLVVLARRGALAAAIGSVRRLRIISESRAARWRSAIASIDANVQTFGDRTTRRALVFVIASRTLNLTGSALALVAADVAVDPPLVIGMLSVGILIAWAANVVPLGLGVADGGNYLLSNALGGAGEGGVAFTMVNRVRTVILAAIGLSVMAFATRLSARGRS